MADVDINEVFWNYLPESSSTDVNISIPFSILKQFKEHCDTREGNLRMAAEIGQELVTQNAQLAEECDDLNDRIGDRDKAIKLLTERLELVDADRQQLSNSLSLKKDKYKELKVSYARLEESMQNMMNTQQMIREDASDLDEQLKEYKLLARAGEAYKQKTMQLLDELGDKELKLDQYSQDNRRLQSEKSHVQTELQRLQSSLATNSVANAEVESLKRQIDELEGTKESLQKMKSRVSELEGLKDALEKRTSESVELTDMVETLTRLRKYLEEQHERDKIEIDDANLRCEKLTKQLRDVESQPADGRSGLMNSLNLAMSQPVVPTVPAAPSPKEQEDYVLSYVRAALRRVVAEQTAAAMTKRTSSGGPQPVLTASYSWIAPTGYNPPESQNAPTFAEVGPLVKQDLLPDIVTKVLGELNHVINQVQTEAKKEANRAAVPGDSNSFVTTIVVDKESNLTNVERSDSNSKKVAASLALDKMSGGSSELDTTSDGIMKQLMDAKRNNAQPRRRRPSNLSSSTTAEAAHQALQRIPATTASTKLATEVTSTKNRADSSGKEGKSLPPLPPPRADTEQSDLMIVQRPSLNASTAGIRGRSSSSSRTQLTRNGPSMFGLHEDDRIAEEAEVAEERKEEDVYEEKLENMPPDALRAELMAWRQRYQDNVREERLFIRRISRLRSNLNDANLQILNKTLQSVMSFDDLLKLSNGGIHAALKKTINLYKTPGLRNPSMAVVSIDLLAEVAVLMRRCNDFSEGINNPTLEKLEKFNQSYRSGSMEDVPVRPSMLLKDSPDGQKKKSGSSGGFLSMIFGGGSSSGNTSSPSKKPANAKPAPPSPNRNTGLNSPSGSNRDSNSPARNVTESMTGRPISSHR